MVDFAAKTYGELASLALAGQQQAYAELLHRNRATVFRIARHHCGDDDAALDITQQAFIAAFAALARFDATRSFPHWIARIAINKSRDWTRRQKVRRLFGLARPLEEARELADVAPGTESQAADRQELRRTLRAIAELPANLKEALVLRTIEGLSQAETARILGVTEKVVETRLYRARKTLAARIDGNSA